MRHFLHYLAQIFEELRRRGTSTTGMKRQFCNGSFIDLPLITVIRAISLSCLNPSHSAKTSPAEVSKTKVGLVECSLAEISQT